MTINGFKSYSNSLTPVSTVKNDRTDAIVNVSTPQAAAEVAKDLEGAIQHTSAKDTIKLATKIDGNEVSYVEVSREQALDLLKHMKAELGADANVVLAKVSIPESPNHDVLLTAYQSKVNGNSEENHAYIAPTEHHEPVAETGDHGGGHEVSKVEQEIMNKLGLIGKKDMHGHTQTIAKNLYKVLHDDHMPLPEKAKCLAIAMARFNELRKENPELTSMFDKLKTNPTFNKITEKFKHLEHSKNPAERVMFKVFADGINSEVRLGHLGKLMDDKLDWNDPRAVLELAIDFKGELASLKDMIPPGAMAKLEKVVKYCPFLDKSVLPFIQKAGAKSGYLQGVALLMTSTTPANIASASASIFAQFCKDMANSSMLDKYPKLKSGFEAFQKGLEPIAKSLDDVMTAHMDHLQHLLAHPDPSKLGEILSVTQQIDQHAGHILEHGGGHHGGGHVEGDSHAKAPHEPPKIEPKTAPPVEPKVTPKPPVAPDAVKVVKEVVDPKALKAKQIEEFATKMGLNADDAVTLKKALETLDDVALKDTLKALENSKMIGTKNLMEVVNLFKSEPSKIRTTLNTLMKYGAEKAKQFMAMLNYAGKEVKAAVLAMGDKALKVMDSIVTAAAPAFEKMGIKFEHAIPKLGKFLGPTMAKVLPGLGAIASGYDMVRLGKIAATGQWGDTKYTNPDVKALALLGANLNAVDTGLAVAELFGVGNVGIAANIGLAISEIVVDVAVEHYNDPSHKMPSWMSTGIKAVSVVMAMAAPTVNGPILASIYKDDLTALANNIATYGKAKGEQMVKLLSAVGDAGQKKLQEMVVAGGQLMDEAYKELEKLGSKGKAMINSALDTLSKRSDGIGKLAQLYKSGGATAVMEALHRRLAEAKSNSNWSNGYAGYRALFTEFKDQVAGLTGEAATAAKKMIYELGQSLDQSLDDWVPDIMYSWAGP